MTVYDDEKWSDILDNLEADDIYSRLNTWERQFLGTCFQMNDRKIMLTEAQRRIITKIWEKYKSCG